MREAAAGEIPRRLFVCELTALSAGMLVLAGKRCRAECASRLIARLARLCLDEVGVKPLHHTGLGPCCGECGLRRAARQQDIIRCGSIAYGGEIAAAPVRLEIESVAARHCDIMEPGWNIEPRHKEG